VTAPFAINSPPFFTGDKFMRRKSTTKKPPPTPNNPHVDFEKEIAIAFSRFSPETRPTLTDLLNDLAWIDMSMRQPSKDPLGVATWYKDAIRRLAQLIDELSGHKTDHANWRNHLDYNHDHVLPVKAPGWDESDEDEDEDEDETTTSTPSAEQWSDETRRLFWQFNESADRDAKTANYAKTANVTDFLLWKQSHARRGVSHG
jgi:hypothetical protein